MQTRSKIRTVIEGLGNIDGGGVKVEYLKNKCSHYYNYVISAVIIGELKKKRINYM